MTRVPLIFGTMTLGEAGRNGVRESDLPRCQEILDVYFQHGNELDTARQYAEGTTEQYLAQLDRKDAFVDTKVYPTNAGDHAPEAFRSTFFKCLEALNVKKVRTLYLHAPDRSVPFLDTLTEADALHREGYFEQLGLSNFAAWEVAEIVTAARERGLLQPKIYQAMYNALTRAIETELVPALRKYDMRLVVYNPLAGGLLAGKLPGKESGKGSRFEGDSKLAAMYRERYVKNLFVEAVEGLLPIAEKHNVSLAEVALRWMQHHSALTPSDGVILGASSAAQLKGNCTASCMHAAQAV
ncbi:Aldo/keto reductase [Tilletiopsis washingtonensis]|uniref:Aldo/keto reductase n=1 Tax=Tilletiopsis washingtonensis TaxID=58919 RepID=A0A316ZAJ1_9BASI|nr:Aldo/keto reductase [Tilletiopsis washingtonensis]PWN98569.1 Aldo/keto reductase [Tilletiopsis washingtonensis]